LSLNNANHLAEFILHKYNSEVLTDDIKAEVLKGEVIVGATLHYCKIRGVFYNQRLEESKQSQIESSN